MCREQIVCSWQRKRACHPACPPPGLHGAHLPLLPRSPTLPQDFCKVAEVQFLDNLRRGASINYADLQPNPVPASLGEAYCLLSVIAPQACPCL